ncbi:MAG: PstS family phosphate ABC transporter substrate-binding protein [Pseudomonadota bacterium]
MKKLGIVLAAAASIAVAGEAAARDQIRIVGSSTVFPFATAVAEQFGKSTSYKTPVVESTGSGGGLKLFCAGVGVEHPDITNASRRMKAKEFKLCSENGVTGVVENVVGYDGIVMANAKSAPQLSLTIEQVWNALAAKGPKPTNWNEVDPSLPAVKIEVLGPPPSSGTRDAFEELVMEEGCEAVKGKDWCKENKGEEIREDGAYVEAGENDNLIVSKLEANPEALGVFGFSFLDQNADKIQGANVNGVAPTFENIASGDYPVSRSLYFYVKKAHVGVVPGIMEFVGEFTSAGASGNGGYLQSKGLIPLTGSEHSANQAKVMGLTEMTGDEWN